MNMTASLSSRPCLTLAGAKAALAAAERLATSRGWGVCIAVVDAAGDLLAFSRLDNAPPGSIETAVAKARTAARFGAPTKVGELDSAYDEFPSWISDDACRIYFISNRPSPEWRDAAPTIYRAWVASKR